MIERVSTEQIAVRGEREFRIIASRDNGARQTLIAPDTATCADCLREIFDPSDRRYRYPFTNCTNCGPRFTIVRDTPYDRPLTTMVGLRDVRAVRAANTTTPPIAASMPNRSHVPIADRG